MNNVKYQFMLGHVIECGIYMSWNNLIARNMHEAKKLKQLAQICLIYAIIHFIVC